MWNKSIRTKLLSFVLLPIFLALLIVGTVGFLSAHEEIEEVYDAELSNMSKLIYAIVYAEETEEGDEPRFNGGVLDAELEKQGHKYEKYVAFQVWRKGKLLFNSKNAADFHELKPEEGYSDQFVDDARWRFFVLSMPASGYRIVAAEKLSIRADIIEKILGSIFSPIAFAFPFVLVIAWLGLKSGLSPLLDVSNAVKARSSTDLTPIDCSKVPEEIHPLINSINELLRKLDEALLKERRFTSFAAHELRTPIAVLKLQAQTALKSTDESERSMILESHVRAADRATHMVEQLLTLARLEHADIPREQVYLGDTIEGVIQDLAPLADKKCITLIFEAVLNPVIYANPDMLNIMLRNIIDNAIKYTPDNGEVSVSIAQKDKCICVTITDSGSGIPEDSLPHVTERFFRIAGQKEIGTGLGLSIVQRAAELADAELEIQNRADRNGLQVILCFCPTL